MLSSDRRGMIAAISERLGNRSLWWMGLRADDARSLLDVPQFAGSASIIGRLGGGSTDEIAFEALDGVRRDVDAWDIDDHLETKEAHRFREWILRRLSRPSALVPYRPSRFLSAVHFVRQDRCMNLGMFGGLQAAFEHKPWVESEVARLGIPCVDWKYVADEEHFAVERLLREGPVIIRRSRTSGGAGVEVVRAPEDLHRRWSSSAEAFMAVAPYLEGALPVNIGATVWHDGVTLSHPSVQLIGIVGCTTRPFGYCGNDFATIRELDPGVLSQIDSSTCRVGEWLRSHGYRGTFGVDYLVTDGVALFSEVNPRFQGSTHLSAQISVEAGESCLLLDHLGAFLGFDRPGRRSLKELASTIEPFSHIVVHWTGDRPARIDPAPLIARFRSLSGFERVDVATRSDLVTLPGGVVARVAVRRSVSADGFTLRAPWRDAVSAWRSEDDPGLERDHSEASMAGDPPGI